MSLRHRINKTEARLNGVAPEYLTQPTMPVPTWEYAIIQMDRITSVDSMKQQIALMGSYGWEMYTTSDNGFGFMRQSSERVVALFFKRRTS